MRLREVLEQVPDPRGRQGREHRLRSILALLVLAVMTVRNGCMAAFRLGLKKQERLALGFGGKTPCPGTLTETLRVLDPRVMFELFGALEGGEDVLKIDVDDLSIDGKTMRASADGASQAMHVLAAFAVGLARVVGAEASGGRGLEIPDALELLKRLDLKGRVVTGDAMFCQRSICKAVTEGGGDYSFPVKDNQPTLKRDIETAFNEPVFPTLHP
jgi:hypothetical protein